MCATTCVRYGNRVVTLGSRLPSLTFGYCNPNPITLSHTATIPFATRQNQSSPSSSSTQFLRSRMDSTAAASTVSNGAYDGVVRFPLPPSSKWSVDGTTDARVNPANERMLGGSGADGPIHRAAGPDLLQACYRVPEVRPRVRCPTGEARITPGFRLPASHVIHTVGPIYNVDRNPAASLRSGYSNSLKVAKENNIQYVAFTAISCGVYG